MSNINHTNLMDAEWHKSSRSSGGADNCVEVANIGPVVGIRDTKDRPGGHLEVTDDSWMAFLAAVTY
jgi:hypothetical protein